MDRCGDQKRLSRLFKIDKLYLPSFNFKGLEAHMRKLKALAVNKKSLFFNDSKNCLPLYRPFATFDSPNKLHQTFTLPTKEILCNSVDDEIMVKHRRQSSEKIKNFELKPIRVREDREARRRRRSLSKTSHFDLIT